jgi:cob(I)alamin adenosyltransferase
MKIYTKGGDGGQTSLFGGRRLSKSHLRIDVYGTVDELNSWLGKLTAEGMPEDCTRFVNAIQQDLFLMGSHLAATDDVRSKLPEWPQQAEIKIEQEIDRMEAFLPPLTNFILPGGTPSSASAHLSRCVCRRAERLMVALSLGESVSSDLIRYLNRLSDYLFTLARYIMHSEGAREQVWRPSK